MYVYIHIHTYISGSRYIYFQMQWQILFSWAPKSLQTVTAVMKLRHLTLVKKAMTNPDSILKSRDITLPKKVIAMVFRVAMYGCESWTIKRLSSKELMLSNCGVEKTLESL